MGFNPLNQVAENTVMSMAEVYDAISNGELSVEEVTKAMQQMTSEGGQYFGLMEKQSQTLNGQLSTLSDNVKTKLGEAFSGVNDILKNDLVPTINKFLSGQIDFSTFVNQIVGIGTEVVTSLGNSIASNAPKLIDKGIDLIVNLSKGLVDGIPNIYSAWLDFQQNLGDYIAENMPTWIQKGYEILSNLIQGIVNAIPIMIEKLPQIITTFANIINDNFPTILAKGAELLWQLITGILSAIPTLIANIPQIIQAIVSVVLAYNWLSLGANIIQFFANGISSMIAFVQSNAGQIFNTVVNALKNLPSTLLSLAKSMISKFGSAITNATGTVSGAVKGVFNAVVNGFKSLPSKMIDVGKNIVKGLWNGISNVKDWILGKIKGFVGGIVGGIKSFFGIKSPSRVMAKMVGKYLPQGIAVGFEDEMPKSIKDIQKSLDLANTTISADLNGMSIGTGGAIAQQSYAGDTINNNKQEINFYGNIDNPIENARRFRLAERYGYAR